MREQMETDQGYDEAVWNQMAEQMGLKHSHPEEYGGQGFGFIERVSFSRKWAAPAVHPVLLGCVLAAQAAPQWRRRRQERPPSRHCVR